MWWFGWVDGLLSVLLLATLQGSFGKRTEIEQDIAADGAQLRVGSVTSKETLARNIHE
jgi:hypothetical protein